MHGFSSGAVLALHAAARGLAITKLALLEPPVTLHDQPSPEPGLGAELAELIAAGRRADAVEHFHTSIGVPAEMTTGMRQGPFWPALEALAHTLVYDTVITSSMTTNVLANVATPTLVIDSDNSDGRLQTWARDIAEALPNARHRSLNGEWHSVAPDDLAPVLTEFFTGR